MNSHSQPELILEDVQYQTAGCLVKGSGRYGVGLHLLFGPIGSGKSTIAGLMAGTLSPEIGTVGRMYISRSLLSVQFPEYYITAMTVAGEIKSWGLFPKEVLSFLSLEMRADDPVMTLSRGELKRLHLACVCMQNAELVIYDEPFASLDMDGQEWLRDILLDTAKTRIVIVSTHYGVFDLISPHLIKSRSEMTNGFLHQRRFGEI
ncbi:MAG: ATP-binding cassette domain-containing protein [Methanomicrobiales archaeon]|jgi:energy-coupling factor transport system ATP-binding protein|nr:ATP-binding cassette domain-containing protein [Methanomicrobiales archaeon]